MVDTEQLLQILYLFSFLGTHFISLPMPRINHGSLFAESQLHAHVKELSALSAPKAPQPTPLLWLGHLPPPLVYTSPTVPAFPNQSQEEWPAMQVDRNQNSCSCQKVYRSKHAKTGSFHTRNYWWENGYCAAFSVPKSHEVVISPRFPKPVWGIQPFKTFSTPRECGKANMGGRAWGGAQALDRQQVALCPITFCLPDPGQTHPRLHEPVLLCVSLFQHLLHLLDLPHVQTTRTGERRGRGGASRSWGGGWRRLWAQAWGVPGHVVRGAGRVAPSGDAGLHAVRALQTQRIVGVLTLLPTLPPHRQVV